MYNVVISYPNAGRTWLKKLTDGLDWEVDYTHQGSQNGERIDVEKLIQYYDQHLERYSNLNLLLLHREIKDNMVSTYFQTIHRVGHKFNNISDFIRHPLHGVEKLIRFNSYWKNYTHCKNLFVIRYEDLNVTTSDTLNTMARYFGENVDQTKMNEVVEYYSFHNMHHREANQIGNEYYQSRTNVNQPETFKSRKGKVGGYVDYMTPEDIEYCDTMAEKYNYIELMK